jgi:hypothetical protein
VAKVELQPVGNFSTSGIATFKEVGDLGVEVELEFEGLPKSGATYFATSAKEGAPMCRPNTATTGTREPARMGK